MVRLIEICNNSLKLIKVIKELKFFTSSKFKNNVNAQLSETLSIIQQPFVFPSAFLSFGDFGHVFVYRFLKLFFFSEK